MITQRKQVLYPVCTGAKPYQDGLCGTQGTFTGKGYQPEKRGVHPGILGSRGGWGGGGVGGGRRTGDREMAKNDLSDTEFDGETLSKEKCPTREIKGRRQSGTLDFWGWEPMGTEEITQEGWDKGTQETDKEENKDLAKYIRLESDQS